MKIQGMSREAYFALSALSNSKLNEIDLNDGKFKPRMVENALSFGSLVDAILTQRQDVDTNHSDYQKAVKMVDKFMADEFCRTIWEHSEKQSVYTDMVSGTFNDDIFELYCKCLYDFDLSDKTGADLKTGSCWDYQGFLKIIDTFDWDQQAFFYMHVSGKKSHSIICLSKLRIQPPFKKTINTGDELWWRGRAKAMEKMWYYNLLRL